MTDAAAFSRNNALNAAAPPRAVGANRDPRTPAEFRSVFQPAGIEIVKGHIGRSSILSQLVGLLVRTGAVPRERGEDIVQALLQRERFGSSALERGLATPGLVTPAVDEHVGAAIACPDGVAFGALDNAPTHLIVLLLSPAGEHEMHSQLLGRLAGLMHDKRLAFVTRSDITAEDIYELLADLDR